MEEGIDIGIIKGSIDQIPIEKAEKNIISNEKLSL